MKTVQTGTVTGDLWIDASPPPGFPYSYTKTFTLPAAAVAAPGRIRWARLYVSAYAQNMQSDYKFNVTTRWDGDGTPGYEQTWIEPGHASFTSLVDGGNDNSAFAGHGAGEPYRMINDHEYRVTSDYFLWYDVRDLIRNQTIFVDYPVSLDTTDGRVKIITLVIAYDDPGSFTQTQYWVNQGEDECSYYQDTTWSSRRSQVAVGTTSFGTGSAGPFTSATLTVNYIASHNGLYAFPRATNDNCTVFQGCSPPSITFQNPLAAGSDVQEPFSGIMHWDVTSRVIAGQDSTLAYARDVSQSGEAGFYKIPLAFLVLKNPLPPLANFTANTTGGNAPLTVQFNDTSTGSPTGWAWDFTGDGSADSAERNATWTYTAAGTYAVSLRVTSPAGSDTIVKQGFITVGRPAILSADFTNVTPRSGIVPLTVQFHDLSTGSPSAWNWTFGDSVSVNTSRLQNPSHTYTLPGTYDVNLTIESSGGWNSTIKAGYVTVSSSSGMPTAAFSATPRSGTAPLTVRFTDLSAGTPTSWAWDFNNDGNTDNTTQNPWFTFPSAGTYSIRLRTTNSAGSDEETKTGYITIYSRPVISVQPQTQSLEIGGTRDYQIIMDDAPSGIAGEDLTVKLEHAGIAEITGITYPPWAQLTKNPALPNQTALIGGTDTNHLVEPGAIGIVLANITIRGNTTGLTQLSVNAVHMDDDNEGVAVVPLTDAGTVVVGPYAGPVAAFTANISSGPASLTVQFTDQSSNSPTSWAWDFNNDGVIDSTLQNPSCTYTSVGTYSVNLTVSNGAGTHSLVKFGYITVTAGLVSPPVAAFTAVPVSGHAPLSVQFTDQSSGSPASLEWTFGDGNISTLRNPSFTYSGAGTYSVRLTVTNAAGSNSSLRTNYITVASADAPVASFSATPSSGTVPLTVTFTDTSTGSPTSWSWDFGDGNTSSLSTKMKTYSSPGLYTVHLTVSNNAGSDTTSRVITVNTATGLPGVAFTADPVSGAAPLVVSFTDQTSGSPNSWSWDFGDGESSALQNPAHTYNSAGSYSVKLTATNGAGSAILTKDGYISATVSSAAPDLVISSAVPNQGRAGGTVFALEDNPVNINIRNTGTGGAPSTSVRLQSGDGFSGTAAIPALAAGANTTVTLTDTTIRQSAGTAVTYTATVDPDNLIAESSESNNGRTGSFPTLFNGYKGKRYWPGSGDIITRHTFDLDGGLLYSFGNSAYQSAGDETILWQASSLPVPEEGTIKAAYLYVPYTWDNDHTAPDKITLDFNGQRISRSNWFHDKSNFGNYADYEWGLITYDITPYFQKNAVNNAAFKRTSTSGKISPYGFTLAVVYEDPSASRKQIFINEEFDLLGASASEYGTSPAEATAYVPFTGITVDTSGMKHATLITFVPSGEGPEGNLLFNGRTIASGVWDYGSTAGPQVAVDSRDVTAYVQASGNIAGIQSTDPSTLSSMAAAQQFLIIDFGDATSAVTTETTTATPTETEETNPVITGGGSFSQPVFLGSPAGSAPSGTSGGATGDTGISMQGSRAQAGPSERSEGPARSSTSSLPAGVGDGGVPLGLLFGGMCMVGATSAMAYRNGLITNGNGRTRVFWEGNGSRYSCQSIDLATGTVCYRESKLPGAAPLDRILIGIAIAGILILLGIWLGTAAGQPAYVSPAAAAGSGLAFTGSFDIIPTIENIRDLDITDHAPEYPAGFSARNGLLFVYHGTQPLLLADLEVALSKGTARVTLTPSTVPPAANAIGEHFSSYLEEMGNGNGMIEDGEWLMVYADNCYDSSGSAVEPRGRVLVWQPLDAGPGLEVPVTDTVNYVLRNTPDGTVLQQGQVTFLPGTP